MVQSRKTTQRREKDEWDIHMDVELIEVIAQLKMPSG